MSTSLNTEAALQKTLEQMPLAQCGPLLVEVATRHKALDQAYQVLLSENATRISAATTNLDKARTANHAHTTRHAATLDPRRDPRPLRDAYGAELDAKVALASALETFREVYARYAQSRASLQNDDPYTENAGSRVLVEMMSTMEVCRVTESTAQHAKFRLKLELLRVGKIVDEGVELLGKVGEAEVELEALKSEGERKEGEVKVEVERARARVVVVLRRVEELGGGARWRNAALGSRGII